MSVLGIDIGTTGCKAAAFSDMGTCIAQAYREYALAQPRPGWAELDSNVVWQRVCEIITHVASGCASDPVRAVCVSAIGEAATAVGAERRILAPCILGGDTRGGEYVHAITETVGAQRLYDINPNIPGPHYTLPKILWLREHEPELFARTKTFLLWDGLVGHLLGCEPFISYSSANRTMLFDIAAQDWSDTLCDAAGISRAILPRCLPAGAVAGEINSAIAARLGLGRGVKVIVGGHDQCCGALGAGVAAAGSAVDGIGTFECITPVYDTVPDRERMRSVGLNIEHHVVEGLYVSFVYNQAGSLVRWFRDTFAGDMRSEPGIYDRLGSEMPVEPGTVLVLPYFEPSGAPEFTGESCGVLYGLTTATTRGEILKAIMECATFYFVQHAAALSSVGVDTSEFTATGGGARSDAWLQIKADIMGVPYVRLASTECGLAGAAILAGVATGVFDSVAHGTRALVRRERVFEPDMRRHALYREKYERYRRLRETLGAVR